MTERLVDYRRTAGWLGANFLYFEQLSSTNDHLLALGEQGAPEGTVVVADVQSRGRGRMQRRWLASPGTSLLMSLLFRPRPPFAFHASRATMLCGLALVEAVTSLTALPVSLKWPNDLILEEGGRWKKVAGMLSEIGTAGNEPAFLVVGIGLNVTVPAGDLPRLSPNATSLSVELGRPVSRVALLGHFLECAESLYGRMCLGWDPLSDWRAAISWLGRRVDVHTPTGVVTGIAEDVDAEGALLLRALDGTLSRFPVGDVSLRI